MCVIQSLGVLRNCESLKMIISTDEAAATRNFAHHRINVFGFWTCKHSDFYTKTAADNLFLFFVT